MAAPTLTISGKVLGKSQNLFTSWEMALPDDRSVTGESRSLAEPLLWRIPLAELLTEIVRSEIRGFRDRQSQRRLTKVLGLVEIEAGVALGKIDSGGSEIEQVVDELGAVENALQAFKDGFYLVFIDDRQQEDLEELVVLTDRSELLFLRLTPLVGG